MRSKEVEEAINILDEYIVGSISKPILDYIEELEANNYEANNIINNQIELLKDSTSNSVIRDKMEELNKQIENELLTTWLEAKIEVLKELLESEK